LPQYPLLSPAIRSAVEVDVIAIVIVIVVAMFINIIVVRIIINIIIAGCRSKTLSKRAIPLTTVSSLPESSRLTLPELPPPYEAKTL